MRNAGLHHPWGPIKYDKLGQSFLYMGLTRHILNCGQEKSRFFQYKYIELIDKKATFFQDCPSLSNFSLGVRGLESIHATQQIRVDALLPLDCLEQIYS